MTSITELLRRAASGDSAATNQLLEDLYPEVQKIVHDALARDFRPKHKWMMPMFSTGDIVQEVFLGVIRDPSAYEDRSDSEIRGWIATQVKNRIIDRLRYHFAQRRDVRKQHVVEDSAAGPVAVARDPTPSRFVRLDERVSMVDEALAGLDDRQRELWQLRFVENHAFADIAEAMGYANAESARAAFRALRARLIMRLDSLGFDATQDGIS